MYNLIKTPLLISEFSQFRGVQGNMICESSENHPRESRGH